MPTDRMTLRFHRRWFFASLASMMLVLVLTHIPQEALPRALHGHLLDKVEHMGAYGWVAILFLLSLRDPVRPIPAVAGLLVLAGIGVVDETTQPLVNRTASVSDYVSDLIGIALAGAVFLIRRRRKADRIGS